MSAVTAAFQFNAFQFTPAFQVLEFFYPDGEIVYVPEEPRLMVVAPEPRTAPVPADPEPIVIAEHATGLTENRVRPR